MIWGYPQFRNPLQYGVMVIKRFCVLSLKWLEHARTCWKISQFLRRDKCLSAFRALVDQTHSHLTTREHQKKVNHLSERWDLEWSWNNNLCAVDIWVWALKKSGFLLQASIVTFSSPAVSPEGMTAGRMLPIWMSCWWGPQSDWLPMLGTSGDWSWSAWDLPRNHRAVGSIWFHFIPHRQMVD